MCLGNSWCTPVPWDINVGQVYGSYLRSEYTESPHQLPEANEIYGQNSIFSQSTWPSFSSHQLRLRRLSATVLLAHLNIYIKYIYPIVPIISADHLIQDARRPKDASAQRYAFLTALCAATNFQLHFDAIIDPISSSPSHDRTPLVSGEKILAEAVRARNECDNIYEQVNTESLLTSFFLFAAYGNLDRHDQAWFYLNQAISMAMALGFHQEATFAACEREEAEKRRRVFWLLFVTERQ